MGRKLRHLLMLLLIILKEPNMPEAGCSCAASSSCICPKQGLTSVPQSLPTNISQLDLGYNQIRSIKPGTFANLTKVQELSLLYNKMTMIQEGIFVNLPELEVLRLQRNQITKIQSGTFVNLPKLLQLDLSNNQMKMIQAGTFANLPRLQDLQLYSNKITMIQEGSFVNLPELFLLRLQRNQIPMIQSGTFVNLPKLHDLSLSYNNITVIGPDSFANLSDIKVLSLYSNRITMIQEGTFVNLPRLQVLSLYYNHIPMIHPDLFANLSHIQDLYLYSNNITMIQAGTFANLPQLQVLYLSSNQIRIIREGTFVNLPLLKQLYLQNNQITTIKECAFTNLPKLRRLDLKNNKMFAICPLAYGLLPSNLAIKLNGNPWQCDCKMAPFRLDSTKFPSFKDQIICDQSAKFRGQKLKDINPEELVCAGPTISALPTNVQVTCNNRYNDTTGTSPAGKNNKPRTIISNLQTISNKTEDDRSAPNYPIPVLIGSVCGPIAGIALIGTVILTIWCKRRAMNPPLGPSSGQHSNIALSNFNMTGTSGHCQTEQCHDHQYEDIHQHNQTGQGQSQAITQSNPITTATSVTSGHDHQYEDVDKQHNQTGQGQCQAISESNPNTTCTAAAVTSADDHQYEDVDKLHVQTGQGQSQSNINNKAVGMCDHDPLTGQGHPHTIMEDRNPAYGTGQIGPMQSSLYKVSGQSQAITKSNINTTAIAEASDHDRTGQDQSQAIIEDRNPSYGTGQISPMQSSVYQDLGQSHEITESNPNTTADLVTSCHDHLYKDMSQHNDTDLGQSRSFMETINPSYDTGQIVSAQISLYKVEAQSQAIAESNTKP